MTGTIKFFHNFFDFGKYVGELKTMYKYGIIVRRLRVDP